MGTADHRASEERASASDAERASAMRYRAADLLLQAQSARFAGLDPMLPAATQPPDGDVITAALPDGDRVAGVVVRGTHEPGSVGTLWSALDVWELHPLLGT